MRYIMKKIEPKNLKKVAGGFAEQAILHLPQQALEVIAGVGTKPTDPPGGGGKAK